jgi:hypothetical protein
MDGSLVLQLAASKMLEYEVYSSTNFESYGRKEHDAFAAHLPV